MTDLMDRALRAFVAVGGADWRDDLWLGGASAIMVVVVLATAGIVIGWRRP